MGGSYLDRGFLLRRGFLIKNGDFLLRWGFSIMKGGFFLRSVFLFKIGVSYEDGGVCIKMRGFHIKNVGFL